MDEDEQFNQAFGEHTGIDEYDRGYINDIKDNNSNTNKLVIRSDNADDFTDQAWRLLGRYIANNTHLKTLDLDGSRLTDERMGILFSELDKSSLSELDIRNNPFGISGTRSMIQFLENSPYLSVINISDNNNFDSGCLKVLVPTLHGRQNIELYFRSCHITDISAFDTPALSNLNSLALENNNIDREGCITLANLLQKEGSKLEYLDLDNTSIDDEGAEILAEALKYNTKLDQLYLSGNNSITEKGCKAFLKLLADISSIENTYNSNYTLINLNLPDAHGTDPLKIHIEDAVRVNKNSSTSHAAGREKVISYQLFSQKRKDLCRVQGIEHCSIGNLFADIEPALLPRILALIGEQRGHSEFYTTLIPMVPDLMSFIDRKAMLKESIKSIAAEISSLTSILSEMNSRLTLIDSGESKHSGVDGEKEAGGGEKRQRIN